MVIERLLLEIDIKYKFMLDFKNALKLYEYLKDVGTITNYSFLLQDEFQKKHNDIEKLKEYHKMIMESDVDFNASGIVMFIEYVRDKFKDEDFITLVEKNKFW